MTIMNRTLNVIFGTLSLMWYSISFPILFEYLFINVSLEPIIGSCREQYEVDACKPLTRLLLWLMELPPNFVIFCAFSLVIVLLEKKVKNIQLKYLELTFGIILGYAILILSYSENLVPLSHYIITVVTYALLLIVCVWGLRHLTSKGTGRDKAAPVL